MLLIASSQVSNGSISDATLIGGKARGLRSVPDSWIPQYFVVSSEISRTLFDQGTSDRSAITEFLHAHISEELRERLDQIQLPDLSKLIIRSSVTDESLATRGEYASVTCTNDFDALISELVSTYEKWLTAKTENQYEGDLALIVQQYKEPKAKGHLSNERRISNLLRDWLIEHEPIPDQTKFSSHTFKLFKHRFQDSSVPERLVCPKHSSIDDTLHYVAKYTTFAKQRVHFEWVWDGIELWIVQADLDPETPGKNPRYLFEADEARFDPSKLRILRNALDERSDRILWQKILNVARLRDCDLPTTKLWVLDGPDQLRKLSQGQISEELSEDIGYLCVSPVIVRTDLVKTRLESDRQMLPRTNTLLTAGAVIEFVQSVAAELTKAGIPCDEFCFLLHHFISSTSSAYCYASPRHKRVHVDSIWGLPDGLSYYAHDSFELDPSHPDSLVSKRRYKELYLAPTSMGDWVPQKSGYPYDWQQSIGTHNLMDIAKATKKFSDCIDMPVRLMWFVEIPSETGHPRNLPWYYETDTHPIFVDAAKEESVFAPTLLIIRNHQDIDAAFALLKRNGAIPDIRLYPDPTLVRDKSYIDRVAKLANEGSIAVILHGSVLQHAYYQLKSRDIRVMCIDPFQPRVEGQVFQKLVRDRIPERIRSRGEDAHITHLSGDELLEKLREKISEEAYELFWAGTSDEVLEELADLYEVLEAYEMRLGIKKEDVQLVQERKREERGGFEDGIILLETRESPIIHTLTPASQPLRQGKQRRSPTKGKGGIIKIPPTPIGTERPAPVEIRQLGLSLFVKYEKDHISIELRRHSAAVRSLEVDSVQLELPFKGTEDGDSG